MARYTKKDREGHYYIELAGEKHYTDVWGHLYGEAINKFAELENADVVPKSEVEYGASFYFQLEQIEERGKQLMREHDAEVAREIFEEIEKIRLNEIKRCEVMREKEYTHAQRNYWEGGEHSLRQLSYWIAELKKKYTENKE